MDLRCLPRVKDLRSTVLRRRSYSGVSISAFLQPSETLQSVEGAAWRVALAPGESESLYDT